MKAIAIIACIFPAILALGRYDVDSCGCDHLGKLRAAFRHHLDWDVTTNVAAQEERRRAWEVWNQRKIAEWNQQVTSRLDVQMESQRLQQEIVNRRIQDERLYQNDQIQSILQQQQQQQTDIISKNTRSEDSVVASQLTSQNLDTSQQQTLQQSLQQMSTLDISNSLIQTSNRYIRIESEAYRMMSGILDVVSISYQRAKSQTVGWSEDTLARQTAESAYSNLLQEDMTRIQSLKSVVNKMMVCLEGGMTDFQSLATINEELAKFKASIQYSQVNQVSSQWASDFLMRLDATLSKSITSQTVLSQYSRQVQQRYISLKETHSQYTTIISWTLMRSEEVLQRVESTGTVDMESVKTIVKAAMKITDIDLPGNKDWLGKVENNLANPEAWNDPNPNWWKGASLNDIEKRRSESAPSTPTEGSKNPPPPNDKSDPKPSSEPAGPPLPRAAANRYPYTPEGYQPVTPNGPKDADDNPLDGPKTKWKDLEANRDVIDLEGKLSKNN